MIKITLRSALVTTGLAFGLFACSSGGNSDGGTTGSESTTGTGATGTTGNHTSTTGSVSGTTGTVSSTTTTGSGTGTTGTGSAGTGTSGTGGTDTGGSGTTGTGTTGNGTTGSSTTNAGGNNGGASVGLRFANFASGSQAVDFCYINGDAPDAGWQGPVLALNGQPNGVAYPSISGYDLVNGPVQLSGGFKVILSPVFNVANACIDAGVLSGVTIDNTFAGQPIGANKYATLALEGYNGGSGTYKLVVYGYLDEPQPNSTTHSVLRFINTSPQPYTYDFGVGTGTDFTALVSTVGFSSFGNSPNADSAGYQPFTSDGGLYSFGLQQLSADVLAYDNVSLGVGIGYSFFFGTDQNAASPWALYCNDFISDGTFTGCYWPDGGAVVNP